MKKNVTLKHYGVLGMRWGVKKGDQNLKEDRFVLKKGTTINRVSTIPNETHSGSTYATFKKGDSFGYMARSAPFVKTFNMKMVVTKDLIAPSKKERVDAFVELCKKDGFFLQDLAKAQAKQQIFGTVDSFEKRYKKMTEASLRAKAYNDFQATLAFDKTSREKYFKELEKRGYNMVLDDADAQVLSKAPIIIFHREDTLKVASVNKVTFKYLLDFLKEGDNT